MVILQNLITTNHRKSGESKTHRSHCLDYANPVPCKRGFILEVSWINTAVHERKLTQSRYNYIHIGIRPSNATHLS